MTLNSPLAQIYINSPKIDTLFAINNFYSFLSPILSNSLSFECRIGFTNQKGIFLLKKYFNISKKQSLCISLKELLKENNIESTSGLIMAELFPIGDEEQITEMLSGLGKTTSYYYNLYKGLNCNSVSLVHPQSVIGGKPFRANNWQSNQIIDASNLKSLKIIQANCSANNCIITYSLFDAHSNEKIIEKEIEINAYGTNFVSFDKTELGNRFIYIVLDKLPTGNGKPLIMRIFNNEKFNISHA